MAALAVVAVAAAAPDPLQELPTHHGARDLAVPAPDGSTRIWTVHMAPAPTGPAAEGFAAGVAMMQGVRGTLVTTTDPAADIVVHWAPELLDGQRVGQHVSGTPRIEVALGDSRCGTWRPYDAGTIGRVVAHEIGHALGLPHGPSTSIMSQRLPVAYTEPCLLTEGTVSMDARQTVSIPFTLSSTRTVHYNLDAGDAVDACITPAEAGGLTGWACRDGARHVEGKTVLPPGEYDLRMRCDSWWAPCEAHYAISRT